MSLVRKSSMGEKKIAADQENRSPSLGPLTAEGKEHSCAPLVCHGRRGVWPYHSPVSYVDSHDPGAGNGFCRCRTRTDPTREGCGVLSMASGGSKRNCSRKKMLKKGVRSRNVYENIRKCDKMPDKISDIFGDVTQFFKKDAACNAPLGATRRGSDHLQR